MKTTLQSFLAALLCAALALHALAAPGDIDPTFGANGTVTSRIGTSTDKVYTLVLQPDGKAVAIGSTTQGSDLDLALARYNTDGTLDNTFGSGGLVRRRLHGANSYGVAGALQADGRILVAASCQHPRFVACVERFLADGTPDGSFSVEPITVEGSTSFPVRIAPLPEGRLLVLTSQNRVYRYAANGALDATFNDAGTIAMRGATSMVVQADGRIVVVGWVEEGGTPTGQTGRFVGRRLLADGAPDSAYAPSVAGVTRSTVATLQPDGKLLVAGYSIKLSPQPVPEGIVVARILPDGTNDPSFGQGGSVTHLIAASNSFEPTGIVLRPDGRIALSASRTNQIGNTFQVVQLEANGSLDATFGTGGVRSFAAPGPDDHANAIALQSDGKVVVAGDGNRRDFALGRLLADGALDPGYGAGGIVTTDFAGGRSGELRAVRADSQGRLVVLADLDEYTYAPFEGAIGLLRFLPDGTLDPSFGTGGKVVASLADAPDSGWYEARARVLAIQSDDRILVGGSAVVGGAQGPTLMRFNVDGSVDTAFGGGGRVRLEYSEYKDFALEAIEVLPDGVPLTNGRSFARILVSGQYAVTVSQPPPFGCCTSEGHGFVAMLNWNGTRGQFGVGGITEFPGFARYSSLARRTDGTFIATSVSGAPFSAVRLMADGSVDSSFGGGASPLVKPDAGHAVQTLSTHVEPGGILMTGTATAAKPYPCGGPPGPLPHAAFARFTLAGAPAAIPYVASSLGGKYPALSGATRDSAGRLLLAGSGVVGCYVPVTKSLPAPWYGAIVARMTAKGALDPGFGVAGVASIGSVADATTSRTADVAVLPDGRIAAIVQYFGGDAQFRIVRLQGGDSAIDRSRPGDMDGDGILDAAEQSLGRDPFVRDNDVFADARLFAMQQYRDFLGREGDAGGVDHWTAQLGGAQTRAQMVETFFNSAEFQAFAAPVTRLYFAYFLRIPDYGGLNYWIGRFRAGESFEAISNLFATSPEFVATYGALTNSQFVSRVYENVLGRQPDSGGLAHWTAQIDGGMTRGQMMVAFSESPEYRALIAHEVYVTMTYVGMLRRAPDAGGFAHWVGYLDAGNSGLALIDGFLAAPEYRGRFLP